jgi:hypothetical protein
MCSTISARALSVTIKRGVHQRCVVFNRHGVAQRLDGRVATGFQAGRRAQHRRQLEEAVMPAQLVVDGGPKTQQPAGRGGANQSLVKGLVLVVPLIDRLFRRVFGREFAAGQAIVGGNDGRLPCAVALFDRLQQERNQRSPIWPGSDLQALRARPARR